MRDNIDLIKSDINYISSKRQKIAKRGKLIAKYSAAKTLTGALFVWFTLRSKATSGKVLVFSSYNKHAKHKMCQKRAK